jgi:uncharacterized iron-regulated protein
MARPSHPLSRVRSLAATAALAPLLLSCSDEDPAGAGPGFDAAPLLANVASNVIAATYEDLRVTATALDDAAATFAASPTEPNLAAARETWRAARRPWEQSESFLFGPVSIEGIDPAVDSWPVNTVDLDAVLAGPNALSVDFIDGLEGTLKGFHTIEYLLFGTSGTRPASSFTARELEYLLATTGSLERSATTLANAWSPGGGDFASELASAGSEGSVYVSQKAALQELITGMIGIADEVANGKINDPYATGDATLEESRFSANSITDFQDNLRSLQNLHVGDYAGSSGPGVSDFVAALDAGVDGRLAGEIQAAIDAIGAIPAPFSTAIVSNGPAIEAAQAAVRQVQQTLEADVAPLLDRI